jgi:hypothetical protein
MERRWTVNVEVHIERLVLDGFERGDGAAIAAAMRAELTRLLAGGTGVPGDDRSRAFVDAGSVEARPGAGAAGVGRDAARAVHQSLGAVE